MQNEMNLTENKPEAILRTELLDLDFLSSKTGYDKEDIEMMLEIFVDKVDAQLATIAEAVSKKDHKAIFMSSHAIRGSLVNIGFDEIAEIAKRLELGAKAFEDIDYEEIFLKLKLMISVIKGSANE